MVSTWSISAMLSPCLRDKLQMGSPGALRMTTFWQIRPPRALIATNLLVCLIRSHQLSLSPNTSSFPLSWQTNRNQYSLQISFCKSDLPPFPPPTTPGHLSDSPGFIKRKVTRHQTRLGFRMDRCCRIIIPREMIKEKVCLHVVPAFYALYGKVEPKKPNEPNKPNKPKETKPIHSF